MQKTLFLLLFLLLGCKETNPNEIWIYTSTYKDTVADVEPRLKAQFPEMDFHFYQAGSEEITAKVNAEMLAGGTKADIFIFSDRFWFEEAAELGKLHPYRPKGSENIDPLFKHPDGSYTTVSHPLMVMIYNSDVYNESTAPKSFKEMSDPKWKDKFATGSPLASGTNFTTVAFLQKLYGWDYFKALRANNTISEGGNSSVIRRVQTKERPVGWVLLENVLRLKEDSKIKTIFPEDGAIVQSNVFAIAKKSGTGKEKSPANAEKVADWFFSKEGQEAMTRSFMYSALPGFPAPKGAKEFKEVVKTSPKWSPEILKEIMEKREEIKEEFTHIMFQ
ncbi:MAG: extracellular solute-binding protein [Bdellovibrionota bacterium]